MAFPYRLEILHQQPGRSNFVGSYLMTTIPPFYNEGTSIAIDGDCYIVMDTLVSIEESEGVVRITHQVRVK